MILTIEIEAEAHRVLEGKAEELGMPLEHDAASVLRRDAESPPDITMRLALMDQFVEEARELSKDSPVLSDEATSRAAIYEGRGL